MNQWISQIVVFVVFTAVFEALLPQSKMKKYVRMILGVLLIMVVLEPLIGGQWDVSLPEMMQQETKELPVMGQIHEQYNIYITQALEESLAGTEIAIESVNCTLSEAGVLQGIKVVCSAREDPWVIIKLPGQERENMAGKLQQEFSELLQTDVIVEWRS